MQKTLTVCRNLSSEVNSTVQKAFYKTGKKGGSLAETHKLE